MQNLDNIHHIAVQVKNIAQAVKWYKANFNCEITYQDNSWAMLQFGNVQMAFVLAEQHPPHVAFENAEAEKFGTLNKHRDGTRSVYVKDNQGNVIEVLAKD
jgi:catechol 2,3-dioxygenase-like lactoylglutathione lyase family enzyme